MNKTNKKQILEKNDFRCYKCGYKSFDDEEFHVFDIGKKIILCKICSFFAPSDENKLKEYAEEKIDGSLLETFRKTNKLGESKIKKSMEEKAKEGMIMTRAPFGYTIKDKKLVPNENYLIVQEIFQKFINENWSLNKLAKQYNFSVNGIKKILKNPVYIGKIKFNGQLINSKHKPIITNEQFVKAQRKLENITNS